MADHLATDGGAAVGETFDDPAKPLVVEFDCPDAVVFEYRVDTGVGLADRVESGADRGGIEPVECEGDVGKGVGQTASEAGSAVIARSPLSPQSSG